MKAVLCPVCNGSGEAGNWLKGLSLTTKSQCWGCGGKGWVEVQDELNYLGTPAPIAFDRCPGCGGRRDAPPLTGCPMGSHYGSYCSIE